MIKSFRHKGLERLYERDDARRIEPALLTRIQTVLAHLDVSSTPSEMDLPGFRLHPLKGDLKGTWSVSVSRNWRIIFRFANGHACGVDLVDYH